MLNPWRAAIRAIQVLCVEPCVSMRFVLIDFTTLMLLNGPTPYVLCDVAPALGYWDLDPCIKFLPGHLHQTRQQRIVGRCHLDPSVPEHPVFLMFW